MTRGRLPVATEREQQIQEIVILLTRLEEADTPLKKSFAKNKLKTYPDELIREAAEQMEGMGGLLVIPTPTSMAETEDFVLLWQEQLLSLRSEMNGVIATQKLFADGLGELGHQAPDLIGALPTSWGPILRRHISDAEEALKDLQGRQEGLADLRAAIKEWRAGADSGTSKGGADLAGRAAELEELARTLLPDLARRMKAADDRATEIQADIVREVTEAAQDVNARLKMASEDGYGETYKSIKDEAEKIIDGVSWFLNYFSGGLVPEVKFTTLKVAVNGLVDIVKEGHIRVSGALAESDLDGALGELSLYATYLANLHKIKDWIGFGFDMSRLAEEIPVIGEYIASGFDSIKGVFEAVIDGQIEHVSKLDEEVSESLAELRRQAVPTPQQIQELKNQRLSIEGSLKLIWKELESKVSGLRDEWEHHAVEAIKTVVEKGLNEGAQELYDKAIGAVKETIGNLILQVIPREMPKAVFGFEVSDIIQKLIVETRSEFTEAEKDELAALSA
jgi:hypothetical protein